MINLNGNLLHPGAPEISLLNRSFLFGDGLYESIRIFNGKILFLPAHFRRLVKGMQLLGFDFESESLQKELTDQLKQTLEANLISKHGRAKIHIFRAGTGAYKPLNNSPYFLIEAYSLKDDFFDYRAHKTVRLKTYEAIPLAFGALSGLRTASALPYILAAQYAEAEGVDDVILFSSKGKVAETSRGNIFAIKRKQVFTPSLHTGCIDGILRNEVIRLCDRMHIPLTEKKFTARFLRRCEEVCVVDTLQGIHTVSQLNTHTYDTANASLIPFLKKCLYQYIETL